MLNRKAPYIPFIEGICREFESSIDVLESPCRKKNYVKAKAVVVNFFRQLGFSYNKIGALLNKDHTTIMNADRICLGDPELSETSLRYFIKYKASQDEEKRNGVIANLNNMKLLIEKIVVLFNQGKQPPEIAEELGKSTDFIEKQLKFLERDYLLKPVPDYKNNCTRKIFQKNQKKC